MLIPRLQLHPGGSAHGCTAMLCPIRPPPITGCIHPKPPLSQHSPCCGYFSAAALSHSVCARLFGTALGLQSEHHRCQTLQGSGLAPRVSRPLFSRLLQTSSCPASSSSPPRTQFAHLPHRPTASHPSLCRSPEQSEPPRFPTKPAKDAGCSAQETLQGRKLEG